MHMCCCLFLVHPALNPSQLLDTSNTLRYIPAAAIPAPTVQGFNTSRRCAALSIGLLSATTGYTGLANGFTSMVRSRNLKEHEP